MKFYHHQFLVLITIFVAMAGSVNAQESCSSNGTNDFFTFCESGSSYTYTGNYTLTIKNGDVVTINGNVTINGTLTLDFGGSSGLLRVTSPNKLKATDVNIINSAPSKVMDIDGTLEVTNTLDFNGHNIDMDGTGTVTAGSITDAGNVSCSSEGDCPNPFSAGSCSPAGSGLCADSSMPITLGSFKVSSTGEGVLVEWQTVTEYNFHYFSLQRSANGKEFTEIAKIDGYGNSVTPRDYSYVDQSPLNGRSYYRLVSIDFDGYSEAFKVVSIVHSARKSAGVFPNPAIGGKTKVLLSFTPTEEYHVLVTDLTGLIKGEFVSSKADFDLELKPGSYILRLSSAEFNKVLRVVVP